MRLRTRSASTARPKKLQHGEETTGNLQLSDLGMRHGGSQIRTKVLTARVRTASLRARKLTALR
jgi:hypothetical protein